MSNSLAQNTSNVSVETMVSVINSSVLNCNNTSYQNQEITVKQGDGSTFNGTINWDEAVSLDNACLQTTVNDTSIQNDIDQAISQLSTAIRQQFGALTAAEAINVENSLVKVGVIVKNTYTTTCNQSVFQQQSLDIQQGNRSVATLYLDWKETAQSQVDCVQNNSSVTDAKDDITQELEQAAKAVIENFLTPLLIIAVVVLAIFIIIIFIGGRSLSPNLQNTQDPTALLNALKATE